MRALKALRAVGRLFSRTVLALLLLGSLALTGLSLTVSGVQLALSGALSAAGVTTLAAREAAAVQTRRAATRKLTRETSQRVSKRVARGAVRNSASVFGEAVPVVGVAVIAGALVYEIKDACDTAQDMAGLEAMALAEADPEAAHAAAIASFDCADLIPNADTLPTQDEIWSTAIGTPGKAWAMIADYYDDLPDLSLPQGLSWLQGRLDNLYALVFDLSD